MTSTPDEIRLNVRVPKELNDELNRLLPGGTKSYVIRGLLRTLVRELRKPKKLIVLEALMKDCAVLVYDESLLEGELTTFDQVSAKEE